MNQSPGRTIENNHNRSRYLIDLFKLAFLQSLKLVTFKSIYMASYRLCRYIDP